MWLLSMRNPADVRTLTIVFAKIVIFALAWHLSPVLGVVGHLFALLLLFISSFTVACVVHNAMHCDVFAARGVEYAWRVALSAMFGFPVEAYRPTHNANHHVYTNHEEDHLDTAQMQYSWHLLNLLLFFPTVYPKIAKLERKYLASESAKKSVAFFVFVLESLASHGSSACLISLDWRRALLMWVLPNILGVAAILSVNMLQHDGCEQIELAQHRGPGLNVNSARNFVGPVLNYITCNNGYHTVHHMYTTTHWSEYPSLHEKLVAPCINPDLDQDNILLYLWKTFFWPGVLPPHRRHAACAKED